MSVHSIMNQSFFMPLLPGPLPGPCASGQEANVRMVYTPKVSLSSKWQAVGKNHECCQPWLCHAVYHLYINCSCFTWYNHLQLHFTTVLQACFDQQTSWDMCGTCLDTAKASSRTVKDPVSFQPFTGCNSEHLGHDTG